MIRWFSAILLLIAVVSPSWGDTVAEEIPPGSLGVVEDVLGRVRDLLWEQSDGFFHQGNHERSIATLKLITEVDPTDMEAYSVGSWLMDSKGRESEAVDFLKLAALKNPTRYEPWSELGFLYSRDNEFAKSAEAFERAVAYPDCPPLTWHMLAHSYEKSGQLQKSVEAWEHALKLEPGDPVVLANLERVKKSAGMQNEK